MKILSITIFVFFVSLNLNAKIIYVEPVQNAKYVSIENNIIIGFNDQILSNDLASRFIVTGSISGIHEGNFILTPDRKKIIFKPFQSFSFNEQVEVRINELKTSQLSSNNLVYYFHTEKNKLEWDQTKYLKKLYSNPDQSIILSPESYATLPTITVTISNNPSPGHIFLINFAGQTAFTPYIIQANNDGSIYYSKEISHNAWDYSRQPNGLTTYLVADANRRYYGEDESHNIVDSFYCGNGYLTDNHELRVLNNGHALLMSYDNQIVDMSQVVPGGDTNALVIGLIIQEIDENKNVVFQWRSWDHFNIVDAIYEDLTASLVDPVHGNAIELDNDGNLMISSRHLNEITKISRTTGNIIWRLGGVNNEFTFVNDTIPFHYQHHIRRISNGNITMFDNGNHRDSLFSRALEYNLDEENKIATLVWQYRNSPDIYGPFMGSVQRLKNGNTIIGWGGANKTVTEVTPSGEIALEMSYPLGTWSYRAFRDEVNLTLNAKIAIEGFYNVLTNKLNINDTVTAYIRNVNSPYNIIDTAISNVDSTNFNGNFRFLNVSTGNYYITLKHRNGLETWSKSGGEFFNLGGVYEYDFTSSNSQAFGNNLILKGSKYCIYSGDVNGDNNIDLTDNILILNDASNFVTGYVNSDLDGNSITELSDLTIAYNNSINFVGLITP